MRDNVPLVRDKLGFVLERLRNVSIKLHVVREKPSVGRDKLRFVRNNRGEDEHYVVVERDNTSPNGNIVLLGSKRRGHGRLLSTPVALLSRAGSLCLSLKSERPTFF